MDVRSLGGGMDVCLFGGGLLERWRPTFKKYDPPELSREGSSSLRRETFLTSHPLEGASNLQPVLHHADIVSAQNWSTGERLCVRDANALTEELEPL